MITTTSTTGGHRCSSPQAGDPVTGHLSREHWIVPVRGLTGADPEGVGHAIACRDGTVILNLTCGDSRTTVRLDVARAAQRSTGIWKLHRDLEGRWGQSAARRVPRRRPATTQRIEGPTG